MTLRCSSSRVNISVLPKKKSDGYVFDVRFDGWVSHASGWRRISELEQLPVSLKVVRLTLRKCHVGWTLTVGTELVVLIRFEIYAFVSNHCFWDHELYSWRSVLDFIDSFFVWQTAPNRSLGTPRSPNQSLGDYVASAFRAAPRVQSLLWCVVFYGLTIVIKRQA